MVIDTSAIVAILNSEPESNRFATAMRDARSICISTATVHEAHCVAVRRPLKNGPARIGRLLEIAQVELVDFSREQLDAALLAYAVYGLGTKHPAQLNMGDCFSYALAKTRNLPLLFKGVDFVHTDIEPAIASC